MKKTGLWLEWAFLFVAVPLVTWLFDLPVNKFLIFALPFLYALVIYRWRGGCMTPKASLAWWPIGVRVVVISAGLFVFSYVAFPETFLWLAREKPWLWIMIMLLYPLVSALPQEFFYRQFYFWRYREIMPRSSILMTSSIITFGFLHVMYDNWVAVILSTLGGVLFTFTYAKTFRLRYAWLEHAIYGQVIFTSGLGRFFYEPIA